MLIYSLKINKKKLIIEIAEKNNINVDLQKSIKEKDILLAEVHHRVKNNLAVISGLIDLQNVFVKEKVISDILKDSKNRIKSIALLHEKLYAHKDLNKIDLKTYISELLHFIKISYTIQSKEIDIISEIENVELSMESALPFSLLVNELITNSYKYAFNSMEKGSIFISITECDGLLELVYKDDGIGFDFEKTLQNNSIGTNLINAFAFQLNSDFINNTAVNKGCEIILRFRDL
ncbi:MAG: sensor histidine kinase [Flavobacteriia bacterium]|nr:sensor histidine kinase [Flavobacteriia bacterium]